MRVSFDTTDLRQKLGAFEQSLTLASLGALGSQAAEGKARIVGGTYFRNHTGRVAKTFRVQHEGGLHVSLASDDLIAHYLNVGTEPHRIEGKNGGMLAFYWAKAGRDFIGRAVNHPGTAAVEIEKKEAERGKADLPKKLERAAEQAIERTGLS